MIKAGILTLWISRNAGGLYDAVRFIAQALDNLSEFELEIFGLEDEKTHQDLAGWGSIPINACCVHGPKFLGYSPNLVRDLRAAHLDLLHIHGIWTYPSIASLRWSRLEKKPYLITTHGMLESWALQNARWKKRLASWLYENANLHGATCLHALCESEAHSIRAYGLKNPICVIPNGVFLPPPNSAHAQWEDTLHDGAKVLLYLGRLHPKKGLLNLLYAWHIALAHKKHEIKEWYLVIAGWDQKGHENELKMLCRKLGIQESVIFAGSQFNTDKHATYCRANAFILPSFSEGLPMVILEAWSYNLPVLMTPQCNLPEGFQVGAAIQIEANQESIAQRLNALFSMSDNERDTLGIRGRKLVDEQFTWTKVASDMSSVYEWVLGGGSPPSSVITD
jgi:poly(glycerol-phosphate) alpha-glucosyltransferase